MLSSVGRQLSERDTEIAALRDANRALMEENRVLQAEHNKLHAQSEGMIREDAMGDAMGEEEVEELLEKPPCQPMAMAGPLGSSFKPPSLKLPTFKKPFKMPTLPANVPDEEVLSCSALKAKDVSTGCPDLMSDFPGCGKPGGLDNHEFPFSNKLGFCVASEDRLTTIRNNVIFDQAHYDNHGEMKWTIRGGEPNVVQATVRCPCNTDELTIQPSDALRIILAQLASRGIMREGWRSAKKYGQRGRGAVIWMMKNSFIATKLYTCWLLKCSAWSQCAAGMTASMVSCSVKAALDWESALF